MTQINAYLTFNGNCREAMNFYKNCFGGDLSLQTVEGSPMEGQFPPEAKKQILHASLMHDGLVLLGSDVSGAGGVVKGNSISLSLNCGRPRWKSFRPMIPRVKAIDDLSAFTQREGASCHISDGPCRSARKPVLRSRRHDTAR